MTNPISYDMIIVGAGPGGSACALTMGNGPYKVALIDKAIFPRDKVCGDALSGKVWGCLKYVDSHIIQDWQAHPKKVGSWGIRFSAPNGKLLDVPFVLDKKAENPAPGFVSRRTEFDHFLLDQVKQRTNVEVMEGYPIETIYREGDWIHVKSPSLHLRTKLIVGADGSHSVVRRSLMNFKVSKDFLSAGVRAYYSNVGKFHEENFIELHFLRDLLPCYFWVFPLPNGQANVGLGMSSKDVSKKKVNLRKKLVEVVQKHPQFADRFSNATLEGKIQGFGLPLGGKKRPISTEGCMLTGDAAALIDPFTGEGIGNAIVSGREAAKQALLSLENGDFSAGSLMNYDRAVYKKVYAELKLSRQLQKLVHFPALFNFIVNRCQKNPSLRNVFTMMFDDLAMREQLRNPTFYLNLLLGR